MNQLRSPNLKRALPVQVWIVLFLCCVGTSACEDATPAVASANGEGDGEPGEDAGGDAGEHCGIDRCHEASAVPTGSTGPNEAAPDATAYASPPTSPEQACEMLIEGVPAEPVALLAAAFGAPADKIRPAMIYLQDDAQLVADVRDACLTGPAPRESWRKTLRVFVNEMLWNEFLPMTCEGPAATEYASIDEVAAAMEVPAGDVEWLLEDTGLSWQRLAELLRFGRSTPLFGADSLIYQIYRRAQNPGTLSTFYGAPNVVWNYRTDDGYDVIGVRQPFDHAAPDGPSFVQTVRISLQKLDGLNVLVTSPLVQESLFVGNSINASPRYDAALYPREDQSVAWDSLTLDQEASDLHHLIEVLSPVLAGPWVTTGQRRQAAVALRHQMLYPKEVEATVAFYPDLGTLGAAEVGADAGMGGAGIAGAGIAGAGLDDAAVDAAIGELAALSPIERLQALNSECADRVKGIQEQLLTDLPELIERSETRYCFRKSDLKTLWGWAAVYEWAFWVGWLTTTCEDVPAAPVSKEQLDSLFVEYVQALVYSGRDTAYDYHREEQEWGRPQRLRPEFQALADAARAGLELPPEEPPLYSSELLAGQPAALVELRQWAQAGEGAVLAVLDGDDPLNIWPFANRGNSLQVPDFGDTAPRFSTDVRDPSLEIREVIRTHLETLGLANYIRNESFIDRE